MLKSRMNNVRAQIKQNISSWLSGFLVVKTVALSTLTVTTEFLATLMSYMLDTQRKLIDAEFSKESDLQLVTRLVNYIFSDTLDGV